MTGEDIPSLRYGLRKSTYETRVYKGITLEVCLVTWVGSHLRAIVLPIAFSLSPIFPSVTYCVIPLKLLLDLV